MSEPLIDLSKTNVPYERLCPEHDSALSNFKKAISPPMRCFDTTTSLVVQVDASVRSLGDALLHVNDPTAFVSKSLTETESRYSNIELEMLSIVYGLLRFHQYVYGRHMEVHTDNKPLESINNKHLFAAPPRLTRMLFRIQQYEVNIK